MRHNKKFNHLGRNKAHRDAMLSNMCVSLIMSKRIFTTVAKAKALRKVVEPVITTAVKAKSEADGTHYRRQAFQSLKDKYAVTELFDNVAEKVGDRPGGYTRIIKTGNRLGDNASMCFIELVDYNENMQKEAKKTTRRRTRRAGRKTADTTEATETTEKVETKAKETAKKTVAKKPAEAKKAPAKKAEPKAKEAKKAAPKKADDKKDEK